MKKRVLILMIVVLATSPAMAVFSGGAFTWNGNALNAVAQVRVSFAPGSSYGGAFQIDVVSGNLPDVDDSSGVVGSSDFTTFCVEKGVNWLSTDTYWASIDDAAYSGGVGGGSSGDPISKTTENIYSKWLTGGYLPIQQQDISDAIYYAEGEISSMSAGAQAIYNAAMAAGNATSVKALNLWKITEDDTGKLVVEEFQSQLIPIPAPGAIVLASLGMTLVGLLRRRNSL